MTAAPTPAPGAVAPGPVPLFTVRDLKKHFPITKGWLQKQIGVVKAVDGVSFDLLKGETLGLVGESGSGKSTVARLMLRAYEPTGGSLLFRRTSGETVDLGRLAPEALRAVRPEMQMIFQDPYSSLNPRMRLVDLIGEPLVIQGGWSRSAIDDRVAELLRLVGLRPEFMERYPHAFSGGQRQRIGIARALALNPSFVAADEAVSALDVSVAAQVVNLLQDLQDSLRLTYLFITHDLSMVEHIATRVGVMYLGRLVELAPKRALFARPRHPYTEALLSAVPQPDPRGNREKKRIVLTGEIPDASRPPTGCPFHPRCTYAKPECRTEVPALRALDDRLVACHRAEDLTLVGAAAA
jgi:peptide/nickel transport system ATP-binding protein